ncbi:MAG TPA: hypothetical protein IGS52_02100 [Oscillatoriaceae cyanobacterium M33_DOE_052]|nr:hypothetical protein [Oscillatoriaceae cyanobacterium M33_DOE_052]
MDLASWHQAGDGVGRVYLIYVSGELTQSDRAMREKLTRFEVQGKICRMFACDRLPSSD